MPLLASKADKATPSRPSRRYWIVQGIALALPLLSLLLFQLCKGNRSMMDAFLTHVTAPWKRFLSWLLDPLPFSMAEVCWATAILGLIGFLIRTVWLLVLREDRLRRLVRRLLALVTAVLLVAGGYTALWGANYYGSSFSQRSGLTARGATADELYTLTISFAAAASEWSDQVSRDENGVFNEEVSDLFARSEGIYDGILAEFPCLSGPERTPKPMLFSRLMSYLGFTGFFFPFTGEANLNVDAPRALLPATIAHELAHQRGVAAEQEANFVAILTGLRSDDPAYRYSSALMGYIHLSNALYSASYEKWSQTGGYLNEQVRADLAANRTYWQQFETPVETAAEAVYDNFLQTYGQELGMQSYGACVDLLVAYYFDWRGIGNE